MSFHNGRQIAAILVTGAVGVLAGCIPVVLPGSQDLSGFDEFELTRDGFCDLENALYSASIRRLSSDGYELELSVLEEGTEGVDDCVPDLWRSGCFVIRDFPARELTAAEADQMQAIFEAVTVETVLWYPICISYCDWMSAQWDDVQLTDTKSCGQVGSFLGHEQMDEIVAFLESLADETE